MTFWKPIAINDFVAFRRALGENVQQCGRVWWRRARLLLFHSVAPLEEIRPTAGDRPMLSHFGAVQHLVPADVTPNCQVCFLMFPSDPSYGLASLNKGIRYQVRRSAARFRIAPLTDPDAFLRLAHPVYLEFHQRTQYSYKANRITREGFADWTRTLFRFPELRLLGAFDGESLVAVSVSYLLDHVVYYATFFSTTGALRDFVSDFMLHTVRADAAQQEGVRAVHAARAGMPRGLDRFYLARGAETRRHPALIRGNPIALTLLRHLMPETYRRLLGDPNTLVSESHGSPPSGPTNMASPSIRTL
jgi:hypothetical protein